MAKSATPLKTANPEAKKPSAPVVGTTLPAKLEDIASEIAAAIHETASLSEMLGDKTREAGALIAKKPELLDPFIDACRQFCTAVGLTDGSVKVYLSNMRGVLRAMCAGWKPKADQTLRSMYDEAPKGTGRQKAMGPRQHVAAPEGGEDGDDDAAAPVVAKAPTKAELRRAAIVTLFGHYDDSIDALMDYVVTNESKALRWVESEILAVRQAAATPLRKAA